MAARVLVTGAGGFIGHHMVKYLVAAGHWVRGVYINEHHVDSARNNVLISTHMLEASRMNGVSRFFFPSSACVYPQYLQNSPDVKPLKEEDASPYDPDEGYGWEKLFTEKLCQYYYEDYGLETRVARFHNVYGSLGSYDGGREKAPAAICRKVALAKPGDEIEVWGDGLQTRSFMHIDDCTEGVYRLMHSEYCQPLNLGTDRLVTIDGLVDIVCAERPVNVVKARHAGFQAVVFIVILA